jgi:GNAT superfamily N-acetyltransferase
MRAREFTSEKIDPRILEPDFAHEKTVIIRGEPYVLRASTLNSRMVPQIRIEAIAPNGKSVGYVRFVVHNADQRPGWFRRADEPYLSAGNLSVWNDYQRRGIASAMYNFARELGNDIQPSGTQTDQGRAFWLAGAGEQSQKLDELSFLGSECTKDCSGHRAGYEWYAQNQRQPQSASASFNKGAYLRSQGR